MGCEHVAQTKIDVDAIVRRCRLHHAGRHNPCRDYSHCKPFINRSLNFCFANTAPLSPVQTAQSAVAHGLAVKPSSLSSSRTCPSSILYFDRLQKPSVSAVSSPGTASRDRKATPCRAKLESSTRTQAGSRVSIHFLSPTTLLGVATSVSCLLIARTTQRRRRLMAELSLHKK